MAEPNTEKVKEKAAEVKDTVKEKSDKAEQKVKESVKKAEKGKVGQHIPTSLDNLTFKDIIKCTLLLNAIMTIGLYVIVSATRINIGSRWREILLTTAKFMILIFGVGGILIDAIFFFGRLFSLFKVFLGLKAVKLLGVLIFCFAQKLGAWYIIVMSIVYLASCVLIDLCFVYYLAIFQERLESGEYDENGMPKTKQEGEEQV